jgi:predicted ATPase
MELLERSSFLDALADYAAKARAGSGRLVLVSGESGIDKTALVEAFQAQLHGARWLWGACDGLLTPRPLGPLFDIAGQAGGQLGGPTRPNSGPPSSF